MGTVVRTIHLPVYTYIYMYARINTVTHIYTYMYTKRDRQRKTKIKTRDYRSRGATMMVVEAILNEGRAGAALKTPRT